jgi:CDK inhibitor PHO81
VTPFAGVTLEVGGDVETYWKSMAMPIDRLISPPTQPHQRSSAMTSLQNSPSNRSITSSSGQPLTISSLKGNYIYLVVQVTKDLQPVIYADWLLPESRFDLYVSDVTLAQFEALARAQGSHLNSVIDTATPGWHNRVASSMISLVQLMSVRLFIYFSINTSTA